MLVFGSILATVVCVLAAVAAIACAFNQPRVFAKILAVGALALFAYGGFFFATAGQSEVVDNAQQNADQILAAERELYQIKGAYSSNPLDLETVAPETAQLLRELETNEDITYSINYSGLSEESIEVSITTHEAWYKQTVTATYAPR